MDMIPSRCQGAEASPTTGTQRHDVGEHGLATCVKQIFKHLLRRLLDVFAYHGQCGLDRRNVLPDSTGNTSGLTGNFEVVACGLV